MKFLFVILLVALATGEDSSLLDTANVLWTRVLNGGFGRLGRIDPLYVPVIRVDQTEGNTTYRVILRNLEVTGLKNSTIESIHVVRGKLQSNLSDNEAGYVSYNEQRGKDSIRYRFHSLVKEPKSKADREPSASDQFETFAEYDQAARRYQEQDDLVRPSEQEGQQKRLYGNFQQTGYDKVLYPSYVPAAYGDMRVLVDPVHPSSVRVVYTQNYNNEGAESAQAEYVRPCVGACRPNYGASVRAQGAQQYPAQQYPAQQYPGQQYQYMPQENVGAQAPYYYDQHYNANPVSNADDSTKGGYALRGQFGGASFSAGNPADQQRQNQFDVKGGGNSGVNYAANFDNGRFSVESKSGENYGSTARPGNQYSTERGGYSGAPYQGNYKTSPASFAGQSSDGYGSSTVSPANQFSVKGGANSGMQYSGNFKTGPVSFEAKSGNDYGSTARPSTQYPVKGSSDSGPNYSFGYRNGPVSLESSNNNNYGSTAQPQNQFSVKGGSSNSGVNYSGGYRNGQFSAESNSGSAPSGQRQNAFSVKGGSSNEPAEVKGQFGGASFSAGQPGVKGGNFGVHYSPDFKTGQPSAENRYNLQYNPRPQDSRQAGQQEGVKHRASASTVSPLVEQFEPFKSPLIRLEKQPGYVDIVYAGPAKSGRRRLDNEEADASNVDPRILGFEEIVKELPSTERYIIKNLTNGQPLYSRNDAAKVAAETKRIRDMIRYAKEYQEKQGYYEEGIEFTYHFGNTNNDSKSNDSLTRTKRQHVNATEEEDVMHVVVRIRVPVLTVKSAYALTGKVGKRQLRGNGLLAGNFTDVVGDFTVELKKVDNKTMIVRAARAKLVSKDRKVRLQGMDDTGIVESILSHGLMAAEAVAAMIVDDLATRALNEDNAETMIYKMYKNLPMIEESK